MINVSWPVSGTHNALSIAPAAGVNRDRASTSASSDNTFNKCTQALASTDTTSQHTRAVHAGAGVPAPRRSHVRRPAAVAVVVDAQPQQGMPIQQSLQDD